MGRALFLSGGPVPGPDGFFVELDATTVTFVSPVMSTALDGLVRRDFSPPGGADIPTAIPFHPTSLVGPWYGSARH